MHYLDKVEQKAFTVECKFAVVMATNLGCLHLEVSRPACSSQLSASRAAFLGAAALRTGRWGALKSPTVEAAAYFGTADSSYQGSCQICQISMTVKNWCQGWCFRGPLSRGCSRGSASAVPSPVDPSGHRSGPGSSAHQAGHQHLQPSWEAGLLPKLPLGHKHRELLPTSVPHALSCPCSGLSLRHVLPCTPARQGDSMARAMCWSGIEFVADPWAQAVAVRKRGRHKPLLLQGQHISLMARIWSTE